MPKALDEIMQKEVSRQEFLAIIGLSLASVLGFSHIIRLLTGKSLDHHLKAPSLAGYNSNDYGG